MNFEIIDFNYISLILSILTLIFVGKTYFVTRKTYDAEFEQIRTNLEQINKQKLPYLKLLSVDTYKSKYNSSDSVYDGKYCRIFKGESITKISLNESMAIFDVEDPDSKIENGFIDEIKSHIGKNDAYFTYFGAKPYLILNHASNRDRFIIDHSNVVLTLHNYGATINAMSVKKIVIYYKPEMNIEPTTFHGNDKNKISLSPNENEEFVLFLDEVTTDLNNSLCQMSASTYINTPESFNLLRTHMVTNRLNYNKLEVTLSCWDIFDIKTLLLITFEYNGDFFISSTTILKE